MMKMINETVKNLDYYMRLPYSILLVPPNPENPDDTWYAEIPELEGCMTWGESREAVLELIEDAKRTWLWGVLEDGVISIPEPKRS
jgi:predicted RNase H-like HicB family nuclease